jgi:chromosome segregation and condensation protein ScpB
VEVEEDKIIDNNKYRITASFMRHLGIREQRELPDYEDLSKVEALEDILENNNF